MAQNEKLAGNQKGKKNKVKLLFENWRKYTESQDLVFESKKQAKQWLKQKKAGPDQIRAFFKYLDDEMVGHLGTGKDDVQKYIGWLVTKYGLIKDEGHIALDIDKMDKDTDGGVYSLSSALNALHDYATYIKRNIIKEKDADIGRKTFKEIVALNKPASEVVSRSQEKEMAEKGAGLIVDDKDFNVVRINTEEASCLFGRGTTWCIAATKSQNYFDQYTKEGRVFYILRNENLPEYHELKKIAFVYDQDSVGTGNAYEIFDKENKVIELDEVRDSIKENIFGEKLFSIIDGDLRPTMEDIRHYIDRGMKDLEDITEENLAEYTELGLDEVFVEQSDEITLEKWGDIRNEMLAHLEENPPSEILEEQMEKIQAQYDEKAKYFHVSYDDYGDGYYYYTGGTRFDFGDLDWSMTNAGDDIKKIVDSVLDDNSIYPEHIDYEEIHPSEGDLEYRINVSISPDHEEQPDRPEEATYAASLTHGFEKFADRMLEYDEKYETMVEEMKERFVREGLVQSETFDYLSELKDTLEEKIKNFNVDFASGAVELGRSLQVDLALDVERLFNYKEEKGIWNVQGRENPKDEMSRYLRHLLTGPEISKIFKSRFESEIDKHLRPEMQQMFLPGFEKEEGERDDLVKQLYHILHEYLSVGPPRYSIKKHLFFIPVEFRIPFFEAGEKLEQKYGVQFVKLLIKVAEKLDAIYPLTYNHLKKFVGEKFKEAEERIDKAFADHREQPVTESKKRIKIRILKS